MSISCVARVPSLALEAPLITIRCPGIVDQAIDATKCVLCSLDEFSPVVLLGNIGLVKSHPIWHGFDRTLSAIFVDVGHDYLCPLFCKQFGNPSTIT